MQQLSQSTSYKALIWNSAAQRLYPSREAANADGFPVMQFKPGSESEQYFEKNFTGYRGDVVYILWEGLGGLDLTSIQRANSSTSLGAASDTQPAAQQAPVQPGGWQYARFGMGAKEIVQASEGEATYPDADAKAKAGLRKEHLIAVGTYRTGVFNFDLAFVSDHEVGPLTTVVLELKDGAQYEALKEDLIEKYGNGHCRKGSGTGIVGIPRDFETCVWINDKNSIQLSYDYTYLQNWLPDVRLYYSDRPAL